MPFLRKKGDTYYPVQQILEQDLDLLNDFSLFVSVGGLKARSSHFNLTEIHVRA